ncbi:GspH/FimT family protein [Cupriavidus metallidurans]|uniref:GspH/FimT family protein n=1 Tax=Cupriavidus metallidurans TaxID=119219 RepID=UPI001CC93F82|nr:GspH/FimT family pseudopilin [Cupriavidus metallidurans]UBM10247.1 GspH/FimT family pseudopilin [Cupriavidus metallidurans]
MRTTGHASRNAKRGATLPELLISLAISAILAIAAWPVLSNLTAEQTVAHAADRLAASLALARTIAASRRVEVRIGPLAGAHTLDGGWQLDSDTEPSLAVVRASDPCLRITLRSTAGPAGAQSLRLTPVGYSRSEQGGFLAATFQLRCHRAQRQVRLGAQGRIRICRPGIDVDCD